MRQVLAALAVLEACAPNDTTVIRTTTDEAMESLPDAREGNNAKSGMDEKDEIVKTACQSAVGDNDDSKRLREARTGALRGAVAAVLADQKPNRLPYSRLSGYNNFDDDIFDNVPFSVTELSPGAQSGPLEVGVRRVNGVREMMRYQLRAMSVAKNWRGVDTTVYCAQVSGSQYFPWRRSR